jgi:exonuclease III
LNSDIVLLSDIRLSNKGNIKDICDTLKCNSIKSYDFVYNSSKNKRGVGILLAKSLAYSIIEQYRDDSENILGLKLSIENFSIWIVSIYGPNTDNYDFYRDLNNLLGSNRDTPFIIGGDWNATLSTQNPPGNIDIINMPAAPSIVRSNWIAGLLNNHGLSDPFRALCPDKRDFTYVPRTGRVNRSRLDFFLISDGLLTSVSSSSIGTSLSTLLFDHKPVFLNIESKRTPRSNVISNATICHPRLLFLVAAIVTETYLHHADRVNNDFRFDDCLVIIGNINSTFRELIDLEWEAMISGINRPDESTALLNRLTLLFQQLPDPDEINQLTLIPNPDIIFEILVNILRNELLSFQGWLCKLENCKINLISNRIDRLKEAFNENTDLIFDLERELSSLVDAKLKEEVDNIKLFENLNSEKPKPVFLSLCKNNSAGNLSVLREDNGAEFASPAERSEYIVSKFENIFRRQDVPPLPDDAIEQFLGPDIVNHPILRNSILSDNESSALDSPLTLAELDISAKKGKTRSAPGMDGFSNALIIKLWKYLRHPLHKYALHCFDTGTLTQHFRSAKIKLIPKKGDESRLNN